MLTYSDQSDIALIPLPVLLAIVGAVIFAVLFVDAWREAGRRIDRLFAEDDAEETR